MMINTELLIIGAGPAGLCAAKAAASCGTKVLICERSENTGGQLIKQTHKFFGSEKQHAGERGIYIAMDLEKEVLSMENVTLWNNTTVLGIYEDRIVTAEHEHKHVKINAQKIIIAAGASEKFLAFPGNDLPGIYGAGAVQTLMNVYGVKPAERILMVGAGNIGLIVSYQMLQAGVDVAGIVEAAPKIGGYLVHASKLRRAGVPIRTGYTVKRAYGEHKLEGVIIAKLDENFNMIEGTEEDIKCDALCLAVGLTPLSELCWQAGCQMAFVKELSGHVPVTNEDDLQTTADGIYVAGDVSGVEEASSAMVEGRLAGYAVASALDHDKENAEIGRKAACEELKELRSGIMGARIRSGLSKLKSQEVKKYVNG
ncbi:NAD(P)/FAD-dependent oxidoreductase [Agathobacter sp.]